MIYDDGRIYPLALKLDKKIVARVYTLELPEELIKKWFDLHEAFNSKFNRKYYSIIMNEFKKLLIGKLDGVTSINNIKLDNKDRTWIISLQPIDTKKVLILFEIWIKQTYMQFGIKQKTAVPREKVIHMANEFLDDVYKIDFDKLCKSEELTIIDDNNVVSSYAYSILPLMITNKLVGDKIEFLGKKIELFYAGNTRIVTNPIQLCAENRDYYSYTISFSIQTLPPFETPYLNIDFSITRWISVNEGHKIPYLKECKNGYVKIDKFKLQQVELGYSKKDKKCIWNEISDKCYKAINSNVPISNPEDVLLNPENYINGNIGDVYIPFEYGLRVPVKTEGKDKYESMEHKAGVGLRFNEKEVLFDIMKGKLEFLTESLNEESIMIKPFPGEKSLMKRRFFNDEFILVEKNREKFQKAVSKALEKEKLTLELWYNDGQEDVKDALNEKLKEHFENTDIEINEFKIKSFDRALDVKNEKNDNNLKGIEERIEEITKILNEKYNPTLSFVVLADKGDFRNKQNKEDEKYDPKKAIRIAFARQGRLTQFITPYAFRKDERKNSYEKEKYENRLREYEKNNKEGKEPKKLQNNYKYNSIIKSAILDGYRQLGVLVDIKFNQTLVGIYGYNKNGQTIYGKKIAPFPIFIHCDFVNSNVKAACGFCNNELMPYWKFLLSISKEITNKKWSDKYQISMDSSKIYSYINNLINSDDNCSKTIMFLSQNPIRSMISGISNKNIHLKYDTEAEQIINLVIDEKKSQVIELDNLNNINLIRIRKGQEVADYYPMMSTESKNDQYKNITGVFEFSNVFYSLDSRTSDEGNTMSMTELEAENKSHYSHRNILELYPMYISDRCEENISKALFAVHESRKASLQFETQKTQDPLPLHLGNKIEEYIL